MFSPRVKVKVWSKWSRSWFPVLSSGNLPGFPWDSRPKLLHLPLILETLGVYLFPSNHGSVIFSKKRHDISLLERTQNSNGELFTSNSHKFCNRHPPRGDQPQSHWWPAGGVVDSRHADNSSRESSVPWTNRKLHCCIVTRCTWLVWPWGY